MSHERLSPRSSAFGRLEHLPPRPSLSRSSASSPSPPDSPAHSSIPQVPRSSLSSLLSPIQHRSSASLSRSPSRTPSSSNPASSPPSDDEDDEHEAKLHAAFRLKQRVKQRVHSQLIKQRGSTLTMMGEDDREGGTSLAPFMTPPAVRLKTRSLRESLSLPLESEVVPKRGGTPELAVLKGQKRSATRLEDEEEKRRSRQWGSEEAMSDIDVTTNDVDHELNFHVAKRLDPHPHAKFPSAFTSPFPAPVTPSTPSSDPFSLSISSSPSIPSITRNSYSHSPSSVLSSYRSSPSQSHNGDWLPSLTGSPAMYKEGSPALKHNRQSSLTSPQAMFHRPH